MTQKFWRLRVVVLVVALALVGAACGGDDDDDAEVGAEPADSTETTAAAAGAGLVIDGETIASQELWDAAKEEGKVTLYTGLNEEREITLGAEFTKDTGVDVEVIRQVSNQLSERILTEHAAGQLNADVVQVSDGQYLIDFLAEGITEAYRLPAELDDALGDDARGPDLAFYVSGYLPMPILYNNQVLEESDVPTSWSGLLDPALADGKIAIIPASLGGTGWAMLMFFREKIGEDFDTQLAAQEPGILGTTSEVVAEVTRGEYQLGYMTAPNGLEAIRGGAPLGLMYPEEGTPTLSTSIGKVKDSPHPNAAELYMNWRLSQRGFTWNSDVAASWSPNPNVAPPDDQPTLEEMNAWFVDPADWDLYHDEYVAAWNDVYGYTPE